MPCRRASAPEVHVVVILQCQSTSSCGGLHAQALLYAASADSSTTNAGLCLCLDLKSAQRAILNILTNGCCTSQRDLFVSAGQLEESLHRCRRRAPRSRGRPGTRCRPVQGSPRTCAPLSTRAGCSVPLSAHSAKDMSSICQDRDRESSFTNSRSSFADGSLFAS